MGDQNKKGKELEDAIEKIETAILKSDPSLKEGTFKIETRKIINSGGVRHEIDVFVTISHPKGYNSVFIFEAKNWEAKVGKNEIIVLQEKIDATLAQRGFFVAREFTEDAVNQAAKNDRLELLTANGDFDPMGFFPAFHVTVREKPPVISLKLMEYRDIEKDKGKTLAIDVEKDVIIVDGVSVPIKEFANTLANTVIEERLSREPTNTYPEGEHTYNHTKEIDYNPPLICKEKQLRYVRIGVDFTIRIARPQIISKFDIATRGRVVTMETVAIGTGKIDFSFIAY